MINVLKKLLQQILADIDSGNSNISETEQEEIISLINKMQSKQLSKLESAEYIGVSRATFDNYIAKGWIPEGKKRVGFKEKFWYKYDLDKYLER